MNLEQNTLLASIVIVYLAMTLRISFLNHKEKKYKNKTFIVFYYFLSPLLWIFSLGLSNNKGRKKILTAIYGYAIISFLSMPFMLSSSDHSWIEIYIALFLTFVVLSFFLWIIGFIIFLISLLVVIYQEELSK